MTAEESGTIRSRIKNLLRSPSIKLRRSDAARQHKDLSEKVTLEKVLGITAPGNHALASDPQTGLLAYPAGCVIVLLDPQKNQQHHLFNSSRKAITTLSFSPDGKYIVTGESGHMPAVRVWEVSDHVQVAELQEHKYGVACVAFSPNGKYIVSVGYQHDMMVNVWNWKKNVVVAANKVSSKVTAVSFSDDSSFFVTAGNRHVKFWYLDHAKASKVNATVPLLGRSGLLGELRNNFFTDVACGRGQQTTSTYCITSSGLLCEFSDRRLLNKWVELRLPFSLCPQTSLATCLSVTEEFIFCGCSEGTVRAFSPANLHFLCTLPHPHCLGIDIASVVETSQMFSFRPDCRYPDTVAVTYDPTNRWLSCVYNDHSVYVWDVRDLHRVGKLYSALYHSSCVWSLEMHPEQEKDEGCLPPGSFLSCSSDNTIRVWNTDRHNMVHRNILSHDLQKVIYVDDNTSSLLDTETINIFSGSEKTGSVGSESHLVDQSRAGIRTLRISPDGHHLASGDRIGVLRIHDLKKMEEILNVQAHDSEILCLEFTKPDTGLQLLASASRDRLIHVLDASKNYSWVQTLDEHSSSITAVRFAANEGKVRMISCGADKSIYFRTAQQKGEGLEFTRTHHVVRKTNLYDMDIEQSRKYAAVGCQDRRIRVFNICNGKQKKLYKGSLAKDGTVIKVQIDPSGLYIATSCSDKNINIFDFYSGECVATMFGHSEIVTGLKFSSDCRHLITASGDSCIFVWRLHAESTIRMRHQLTDLQPLSNTTSFQKASQQGTRMLREALSSRAVTTSSDSDKEDEEEEGEELYHPNMVIAGSVDGETESSDARKKDAAGRLRGRHWSDRLGGGNENLMVKSMLDLRLLDSYHPIRQEEKQEEMVKDMTNTKQEHSFVPLSSQSQEDPVLYLDLWEDRQSATDSGFQVKEACPPAGRHDKPSPDSGCSLEFNSRLSSPDRPAVEDSQKTECLSMDGNSSELEEEEGGGGGRGGEMVMSSQLVHHTPDQEAFPKFAALSDVSASGSPSKVSHDISRFLSHNSDGSYTAFPLPFHTTDGGRGEVKAHSLVSEVQNQNRIQDKRVSWNQEQTQKQKQEQKQTQRDILLPQIQIEPGPDHPQKQNKEVLSSVQDHQASTVKKKIQTAVESRRNLGSTRLATAFHRNSTSGLRKTQSVHNLLTKSGVLSISQLISCPSREFSPHLCTTVSSCSTSTPSTVTQAAPRSYMSPTASSMAKISRSVSMGDRLNITNSDAVISVTSSQVRETQSAVVALVPSCTASTACYHAAVVPVMSAPTSSSTSLNNENNGPDSCWPLPDKYCISSFSTSTKSVESLTSSSSLRPPPNSVSSLISTCQKTGPKTPADTSVEQMDNADQPISVETCQALASELQSCLNRAMHLYRKVHSCPHDDSNPDLHQMSAVLSEAFQTMKAELDSLPLNKPSTLGVEWGLEWVGKEKTAALLEEYSLLLLQAVNRKVNSNK
ncbi:mitogen-activated protein kinase-binding protein 1 [Pholidichthys leucotaenia]